MKCLLGIDPEKTQKCKPSECASCGWEAEEAARRREYVKEHGLTLCADGFRRLIIKKENDMATPYKEIRTPVVPRRAKSPKGSRRSLPT